MRQEWPIQKEDIIKAPFAFLLDPEKGADEELVKSSSYTDGLTT